MKFLIDAQLPRRFCYWLADAGFDARHTLDLPEGNRTTDKEIIDTAEREERVLVTKDDDFVQSFLVTGRPNKLLLIATGNISNADLERLIRPSLPRLVETLKEHQFLEFGKESLVIRD